MYVVSVPSPRDYLRSRAFNGISANLLPNPSCDSFSEKVSAGDAVMRESRGAEALLKPEEREYYRRSGGDIQGFGV